MTHPLRTLALLGLLVAVGVAVLLLREDPPSRTVDLEALDGDSAGASAPPAPLTAPGPGTPGSDPTRGAGADQAGPRTRQAGRLAGRVLDEGERPLPGASVRLFRIDPAGLRGAPFPDQGPVAEAVSDREGRFELPAPPRAWLRVVASASGYATGSVQVADAGVFAELRLGRGGTLEVSVRDERDRAVREARVEAAAGGTRVEGTTGADGTVTLAALPAGEAALTVGGDGYGTVRSGPWTIRPGEQTAATVVLPPLVRLAGRILDEEDGHPVAAAEVLVAQPGRASVADPTGADGAFGPVDAGGVGERVFVSVRAPGYAPALEPVVLQADGVQVVEVRLARAAPWTGRVLLPDGGAVAGAQVGYTEDGIAGRTPPATTSGADGSFSLPPPAPPAPGRRVVLYARHGDLEAALGLRPGMLPPDPLELRLGGTARVTGRVVDAGGAASAAVEVRLVPAWGELEDRGTPGPATSRLLLANERGFLGLATATDGQGRWALAGVPPGAYEVRLRGRDTEGWRDGLLTVGPGDADAGVQVLGRGRRVSGRVLGAHGAALAGVSVRLGEGEDDTRWRRTTTDGDGRYAFPGIGPGVVLLDARLGHLEPARVRVEVTAEADRDDVDLEFAEAAGLVGRVRLGNQPYAGLLGIALRREGGAAAERARHPVRVADGTFRWDQAPIGRWILEATAPGGFHARTAAAVDLEPGRLTPVDLDLVATSALAGTVQTVDGTAVAGARVTLDEDDRGRRRLATADAGGRFAFEDLPAGTYTLHAWGRGGAPYREEVAIVSGERRETTVRLPPAGRARIQVVDDRGRPVPGAVVLFRTADGPLPVSHPDRTDRDGVVVRGDLPPGALDVRARVAAGIGQGTVRVEAGGTATLRIDLIPVDR